MGTLQAMSIVGIGATRPAWSHHSSVSKLVVEAALAACDDAGISPESLDGVLSEAYSTPHIMPDLHAALNLKPDVFTANIGLVGSGAVATIALAQAAASTGQGSTFLCVYGLNLSLIGGPGTHHSSDPYKANMEMPFGFYPQPVYMATMAKRYCAEYGVDEDLISAVPITTRAWAALNPSALCRDPLTADDYAASPMIADPLRKLDCCLISDGACAFIVTTKERAIDAAHPPVDILSLARAVEPIPSQEYLGVRNDHLNLPSRLSGPNALKRAGLATRDVNIAYLYDCFSIIPVLQLEDIGFCGAGEGLDFFASGAAAPGGSLPVNTHGGLLSHSYVPGINMVIEAVTQLRGDAEDSRQQTGAEVALVAAWADTEHTTVLLGKG
ncbi:thiolase family protein [Mycobacterium kyogaense]|uniref:thiolase family protein n=1 Tax=Mycobacterium kyogaense TaxID=2212479 RepID=UPI0013C4562D|nr:thiolase family protein [Mycobacterium kyogaense]